MPKGVYQHKPLSEEHKRKLIEKLTGRPVSVETRRKIGLANTGRRKGVSFTNGGSFKKGHIPWTAGRKGTYKNAPCSEQTKAKIALGNSKPKVYKSCLSCLQSFGMWPSKTKTSFYCSKRCQFEGQKGKPSWNKGLKGYFAGENHYNWKGGITPENRKIRTSIEYRIWREAVFARDNFTCKSCSQRGGKLHADHIKPFSLFPELRLAIDNGRTLCVSCHRKTPTWGRRVDKAEKEC